MYGLTDTCIVTRLLRRTVNSRRLSRWRSWSSEVRRVTFKDFKDGVSRREAYNFRGFIQASLSEWQASLNGVKPCMLCAFFYAGGLPSNSTRPSICARSRLQR